MLFRQRVPIGCRFTLAGNEFEMAFDQGEVGSRLIDVSQRDDVFVWHMHVIPEESCGIVKNQTSASEGGAAIRNWHRRRLGQSTLGRWVSRGSLIACSANFEALSSAA
jgi:hypothetical protein